MPSQHRKHRGYETQRIVAAAFARAGWPAALPVGAGRSGSDVTGVEGIDVEVFARRDGLSVLTAKLKQSQDRADGLLTLAVMRPDGWGEAKVDYWPAVMPLGQALAVLRRAGYGEQP